MTSKFENPGLNKGEQGARTLYRLNVKVNATLRPEGHDQMIVRRINPWQVIW
jgi:hypothetical protein